MRIFKDVENLHNCVAGEVLNLLLSKQYFDNGVLLEKPVDGYPSIVDGNITYVVNITNVTISVPTKKVPIIIESTLQECIVEMSRKVPETELHKTIWVARGKNSSHMTVTRHKSTTRDLTAFEVKVFDYNAKYLNDAKNNPVLSRDCGIYVDIYDLLNLPHNAVTFDVTSSLFKASDRLLDQSIKMDDITNHLAFELCNRKVDKPSQRRYNKINRRLIRMNLDDTNYKHVVTADGSPSYDMCSECQTQLYDDNYILDEGRGKPAEQIVLCPVCAHYNSSHLISGYARVSVVKFPTTIHDVIDLKYSGDKADILHASVEKRHYLDFGGIKYVVLGKNDGRYIATSYVDAFMTSPMARLYPNHKIITIL